MSIMPSRYDVLNYIMAGYEKTGINLVGYDGARFFPADASDDIGLYYFVPRLARFLGLSLEHAISYFFYGMVLGALLLGLIGFFLLSKNWLFRIFATVSLSVFSVIACWGMTDVYLVASSIAIAVIPLSLYFIREKKVGDIFGAFLFLSGIFIGCAHYIRSFSSVSVFLFLVIVLIFGLHAERKKKIVFILLLCLGAVLPVINFKSVITERNAYLGLKQGDSEGCHVFWHSLYAGLGFLNNEFGMKWDDKTVSDKIKQVASKVSYPTKEYETAVRSEFFNFVVKHPNFILQTLFAKLGVIFYYLLLFANFGLLAAFFYRKPFYLDCAFWVGIGFNSLFGFMALPGRYYLLGMLAFAVLYGLVSIEYAIRRGVLAEIRKLFVSYF